jgi:molecular chaperone DnaJ
MPVATKRDYYEVLGVRRDASQEEIRKSYKRLARQYHPDVNKDPDADAKFKEINEAHSVLSDSQKRAMYDRFGHDMPGSGGMGADPFAGGDPFSTIFDAFFGGAAGGRGQRGVPRGADLRYHMQLSFEEAIFGCEKEIEYRRLDTCSACSGNGAEPGTEPTRCPRCNGMGEIRQRLSPFNMVTVTTCDMCGGRGVIIPIPCRTCGGEGRTRQSRHITVKVPAGVDNNAQIRISGEGDVAPRGGMRGNLYVTLDIQPHAFFIREGNDVLLELPLNIGQATLGTDVEVPTVDGEEKLKIPAGTQTGQVFRLRGKGVPFLQQSGRGDQLVVTRIVVPKKLTEQQRKLFQELAQTMEPEPIGQDRDEGFFHRLRDVLGL